MAAIEVPFDVLRRAVESAHGHMEKRMHLVRVPDGAGTKVMFVSDENLALIAPASRTEILTTSRGRVGAQTEGDWEAVVTIRVKGAAQAKVYGPGVADALFWTESAIEKFFFPYYQRVLTPDEFKELQRRYYTPDSTKGEKPILAFVHYPPSIYDDDMTLKTAPTNLADAATATFGIIEG